MRALGFCVSIAHAEFMARRFNEAGIPARAVGAPTAATSARRALASPRAREVKVVFAVDLFNEGVDLPEVDTVLFLRPTESATVFLQQLGRGLRRCQDKACLTVLDFIGKRTASSASTCATGRWPGTRRGGAPDPLGFPFLPAGPRCSSTGM